MRTKCFKYCGNNYLCQDDSITILYVQKAYNMAPNYLQKPHFTFGAKFHEAKNKLSYDNQQNA